MKYIIFEDNKTGLIQPVIFGDHTTHSTIKLNNCKPVSAGFWLLGEKGIICFGESESLGLEPKKGDEAYLSLMLGDAGTMFFLKI